MAELLPPIIAPLMAEGEQFFGLFERANKTMEGTAAKADTLGGKFASLGSKVSTVALTGFAGALILGTKYALEYSDQLKALQTQAGWTKEQVDKMSPSILDLSNKMGVATDILIPALVSASKAGYTQAQAMNLVAQATNLAATTTTNAKISASDLATTTQTLITLQALHIKGTQNLTTTSIALWAAQAHGTMTMTDFAEALNGKVTAAMQAFGLGLDSVGSTIAFFADAGLKGQKAGMMISQMLGKMETPSQTVDKHLRAIGLTQQRVAEDVKKPGGFLSVMQMIHTRFIAAGYSAKDYSNFLLQLFGGGARTMAGPLLFANNMDKVNKIMDQSKNAGKSYGDALAAYLNEPSTKMAKLGEQVKHLLQGIGTFTIPIVMDATKFLSSFIDKLKTSPALKMALEESIAGVIVLAMAMKIKKIFGSVKDLFGKGTEGVKSAQTTTIIELLRNIDINTAKTAGLSPLGGGPKTPTVPPGNEIPKPTPTEIVGGASAAAIAAVVVAGLASFIVPASILTAGMTSLDTAKGQAALKKAYGAQGAARFNEALGGIANEHGYVIDQNGTVGGGSGSRVVSNELMRIEAAILKANALHKPVPSLKVILSAR